MYSVPGGWHIDEGPGIGMEKEHNNLYELPLCEILFRKSPFDIQTIILGHKNHGCGIIYNSSIKIGKWSFTLLF